MKTTLLRSLLATALLAGTVATTTAAHAESDFVIVVPVRLDHLNPNVTGGRLSCTLSRRPLGDSERLARANIMGTGAAAFSVRNGAFQGNLGVQILAGGLLPGTNPIPDARSVTCSMSLYYTCTSASGGYGTCEATVSPGSSTSASGALILARDPSAPFVPFAEMNIDASRATILPRRF